MLETKYRRKKQTKNCQQNTAGPVTTCEDAQVERAELKGQARAKEKAQLLHRFVSAYRWHLSRAWILHIVSDGQ